MPETQGIFMQGMCRRTVAWSNYIHARLVEETRDGSMQGDPLPNPHPPGWGQPALHALLPRQPTCSMMLSKVKASTVLADLALLLSCLPLFAALTELMSMLCPCLSLLLHVHQHVEHNTQQEMVQHAIVFFARLQLLGMRLM